jgi:hypothetical protein
MPILPPAPVPELLNQHLCERVTRPSLCPAQTSSGRRRHRTHGAEAIGPLKPHVAVLREDGAAVSRSLAPDAVISGVRSRINVLPTARLLGTLG